MTLFDTLKPRHFRKNDNNPIIGWWATDSIKSIYGKAVRTIWEIKSNNELYIYNYSIESFEPEIFKMKWKMTENTFYELDKNGEEVNAYTIQWANDCQSFIVKTDGTLNNFCFKAYLEKMPLAIQ